MNEYTSNVVVFCIGAYIFGGIFSGLAERFTGVGEKTVYMSRCDVFAPLENCENGNGLKSVHKILIRSDFNNQRVVILDHSPAKHECKVYNSENWECEKGERDIHMHDGRLYDSVWATIENDGKIVLRQSQTGWLPYYLYELKSWF